MLKKVLVVGALLLSGSVSLAGQVLMSCDFASFQDVDNLQVWQTISGMKVDIFMMGEPFSYYSLPLAGSKILDSVDLANFNTFNDLDAPALEKKNNQWFFVSKGEADHAVTCVYLK